ncbi:PDR/VanB family oxidoreductase [Bradyrhizobium canariense]|uniref:Ferredoxin-NADP reductase n=1 Tax=Bradyrhizobium canariense TaxID=255045 RepID=A0A1H1SJB4_9BRAD|nr:PDR/VanB family oxidoreductase [Bradyrhizobium canariense]SDS47449.1 Ferredoxin-NADP reductase [Bradyrhizobium canariense]
MDTIASCSSLNSSLSPISDRIRVRLNAIRYVARDIHLFELVSPGNELPPATAGAHIDIHLPDGKVRQYSLVVSDTDDAYVVAVKRDAQGRGGSLYLHDKLRVGTELEISAPRNNFPLREDAAHSVFIAGGIGITPIWSMIHRLKAIGRSWELHFASRSPADAAFLSDLRELDGVRLHFDSVSQGQPLDLEAIITGLPMETDIYCCGPLPMLEAFERATVGRPAEQIHVEFFAPRQEAASGGFSIKLKSTGAVLTVPPGSSMLDVLLDAGVVVPYSCTEGICGACQVGVVSGIPDHRDTILTEAEHATNESVIVCCSGSKSDILMLDL